MPISGHHTRLGAPPVLKSGPAARTVAVFSRRPRTLKAASRRQFLTPTANASDDEYTSVGFAHSFLDDQALWNDVLEVPTIRDQLSPR